MLNAEQIKAAVEPPAGSIDVPESGGKVGVRRLSAGELKDLRTWDYSDDIAATCRFLHWALCDASGRRLFQRMDDPAAEVAQAWECFEHRGYGVMLRVAEEAQRLNLLTAASREELRKNSSTAPNSDRN